MAYEQTAQRHYAILKIIKLNSEAENNSTRVDGAVAAESPAGVHTTKARRISRIRRTQPPGTCSAA